MLIFLLIAGFIDAARAQTCRVASEVTSEGHRHFIEVYEYDYVGTKPCFPGGEHRLVEYINEHRRYPQEAYEAGISGRVTCQFVVECTGKVSHVKVIKSAAEPLNREAVRILSQMPAWSPGELDGVPVPVRVVWSVPFRR